MRAADMAATHAAAFATQRPWTAEEFAALLAQSTVAVLGDARCFALYRMVLDEAELLTIATRPDARRQGLATAAMTAFHADVTDRGGARCFLEVAADNQAARGLYPALGYRECGRRAGYYRREDARAADAIVMERALR